MVDEEAVLAALFALVPDIRFTLPGSSVESGFVTYSRRVKLWGNVTVAEKPALYQAEHANQEDQVSNMPDKSVVMANWIIYQSAGKDPTAIPAQWNTAILKGVRASLRPTPQDPGWPKRNTLGGLVHHCYISGRVFKDPGDIDGEGMMVVPIKVLVPSLA